VISELQTFAGPHVQPGQCEEPMVMGQKIKSVMACDEPSASTVMGFAGAEPALCQHRGSGIASRNGPRQAWLQNAELGAISRLYLSQYLALAHHIVHDLGARFARECASLSPSHGHHPAVPEPETSSNCSEEQAGRLKAVYRICRGVGKTYRMLEEATRFACAQSTWSSVHRVPWPPRNAAAGARSGSRPLRPGRVCAASWSRRWPQQDPQTQLPSRWSTELAHTNCPRQPQTAPLLDVLELAKAGINVIGAFNVSTWKVSQRSGRAAHRRVVPKRFRQFSGRLTRSSIWTSRWRICRNGFAPANLPTDRISLGTGTLLQGAKPGALARAGLARGGRERGTRNCCAPHSGSISRRADLDAQPGHGVRLIGLVAHAPSGSPWVAHGRSTEQRMVCGFRGNSR